jgi:hypothetical protein
MAASLPLPQQPPPPPLQRPPPPRPVREPDVLPGLSQLDQLTAENRQYIQGVWNKCAWKSNMRTIVSRLEQHHLKFIMSYALKNDFTYDNPEPVSRTITEEQYRLTMSPKYDVPRALDEKDHMNDDLYMIIFIMDAMMKGATSGNDIGEAVHAAWTMNTTYGVASGGVPDYDKTTGIDPFKPFINLEASEQVKNMRNYLNFVDLINEKPLNASFQTPSNIGIALDIHRIATETHGDWDFNVSTSSNGRVRVSSRSRAKPPLAPPQPPLAPPQPPQFSVDTGSGRMVTENMIKRQAGLNTQRDATTWINELQDVEWKNLATRLSTGNAKYRDVRKFLVDNAPIKEEANDDTFRNLMAVAVGLTEEQVNRAIAARARLLSRNTCIQVGKTTFDWLEGKKLRRKTSLFARSFPVQHPPDGTCAEDALFYYIAQDLTDESVKNVINACGGYNYIPDTQTFNTIIDDLGLSDELTSYLKRISNVDMSDRFETLTTTKLKPLNQAQTATSSGSVGAAGALVGTSGLGAFSFGGARRSLRKSKAIPKPKPKAQRQSTSRAASRGPTTSRRKSVAVLRK